MSLGLPVVPLRRLGVVAPKDRTGVVLGEPEAVGVGPDGMAYVVWPYRNGGAGKQITWHLGGERHAVGAIEELLTTPSGRIWVGYFDEAMGGRGPEGHGLARFRADLTTEWLYPFDAGLPVISDCYSLNVEDETAHFSPYTEFHILSASGEKVTDWGASPYRSAHILLKSGPRLAVLSRSGPEYDVATLLRIHREGIHQEGGQCRIVLPDGMDTRGMRYACRGADLHAFARSFWYRINLEDLRTAAAAQ